MLELFGMFVLALLPIIWLVAALCGLHMEAYKASVGALVVAFACAMLGWQMPLVNATTAALEVIEAAGVGDAARASLAAAIEDRLRRRAAGACDIAAVVFDAERREIFRTSGADAVIGELGATYEQRRSVWGGPRNRLAGDEGGHEGAPLACGHEALPLRGGCLRRCRAAPVPL